MIFTDQTHHTIELKNTPQRIISLVPSQTELLYDLGLEEQVVGITKFCVHPKKWFTTKTKIGGTKKINLAKIEELNPDLIIANKEENTKPDINYLKQKYPVWTSDIASIDDNLKMIEAIGKITHREENASRLTKIINEEFTKHQSFFKKRHSALYLIWKNPYMSVGNDTFIHHLMNYCGFDNVLNHKTRYPEITIDEIKKLQPNFIFLSSEPFPFNENHLKELQQICLKSKIMLVDGELFSWYGSRIQYAPAYFNRLLTELN